MVQRHSPFSAPWDGRLLQAGARGHPVWCWDEVLCGVRRVEEQVAGLASLALSTQPSLSEQAHCPALLLASWLSPFPAWPDTGPDLP